MSRRARVGLLSVTLYAVVMIASTLWGGLGEQLVATLR